MFKHILVPTDGSKLSLKALDLATTLAQTCNAKVTVVSVDPPYPNTMTGDGYMLESISPNDWEEMTAKRNIRIQRNVEKRGAAASAAFVTVSQEAVYAGILDTAKRRRCDLIVMASHGRRGLSALLMGSETNKVLTHSKIPVLVCR